MNLEKLGQRTLNHDTLASATNVASDPPNAIIIKPVLARKPPAVFYFGYRLKKQLRVLDFVCSFMDFRISFQFLSPAAQIRLLTRRHQGTKEKKVTHFT